MALASTEKCRHSDGEGIYLFEVLLIQSLITNDSAESINLELLICDKTKIVNYGVLKSRNDTRAIRDAVVESSGLTTAWFEPGSSSSVTKHPNH